MSATPVRRAPRLGPEERLAPLVTRRGRFRKINPAKGRPPIGFVRAMGVLAWAGLVAESFRRARAAHRQATPDDA